MVSTVKQFRADVVTALASAQEEILKFSKRFADNPSHAFQWSQHYFMDAVRVEELTHLLTSIDGYYENVASGEDTRTEEEVMSFMTSYYCDQAMSHADRIASSSSMTANLMEDTRRAYKVQVYKYLTGQLFGRL